MTPHGSPASWPSRNSSSPSWQLREPLRRGHQLAVAAGAVARILERGVRERSRHAVGLEQGEEVGEDVRTEEVGDQRRDLLAVAAVTVGCRNRAIGAPVQR